MALTENTCHKNTVEWNSNRSGNPSEVSSMAVFINDIVIIIKYCVNTTHKLSYKRLNISSCFNDYIILANPIIVYIPICTYRISLNPASKDRLILWNIIGQHDCEMKCIKSLILSGSCDCHRSARESRAIKSIIYNKTTVPRMYILYILSGRTPLFSSLHY